MERKQIETIIALIAGVQTAVVHLSNVVAKQAGIPKESIADSFDEAGKDLGIDVAHRELIAMVLHQVAEGIRGSNPPKGPTPPLLRLVH